MGTSCNSIISFVGSSTAWRRKHSCALRKKLAIKAETLLVGLQQVAEYYDFSLPLVHLYKSEKLNFDAADENKWF